MSDDLISRKTLMEEIQSFRCSITGLRAGKGVLAHAADEYRKSILQIIDNQPIAFDKEKVIEELRSEAGRWHESGVEFKDENEKGVAAGFRLATHIVEKGGLN